MARQMQADLRVGVVIIGRNEGDRLRRCLESVQAQAACAVYVDSGSTDGSQELARSRGFALLSLDTTLPFTAARARNAGYARLLELRPGIQFVQFVDGDCEVASGWLRAATDWLVSHERVAVVCGRRRERFPQASIFNALCDLEWNTPLGRTRACGGDAMMRREAFEQVGGFNPLLIAGEEPDLCLRLRMGGWEIWRSAEEMTLHDAAILTWGQWWRRTRRSGYAFAQGAWMHGAPPERHWVAETRRAATWGIGLPVVAIAIGTLWWPAGLLVAGLIPAQIARVALRFGGWKSPAWATGALLVLGRFPEAAGAVRFWLDAFSGRRRALLEYK